MNFLFKILRLPAIKSFFSPSILLRWMCLTVAPQTWLIWCIWWLVTAQINSLKGLNYFHILTVPQNVNFPSYWPRCFFHFVLKIFLFVTCLNSDLSQFHTWLRAVYLNVALPVWTYDCQGWFCTSVQLCVLSSVSSVKNCTAVLLCSCSMTKGNECLGWWKKTFKWLKQWNPLQLCCILFFFLIKTHVKFYFLGYSGR